MILLTYMPGLWDYMLLISLYAFGISMIFALFITMIQFFIKKNAWEAKKYFRFGLKLFLIFFLALTSIALIYLSIG